jgi:hypothetical protein
MPARDMAAYMRARRARQRAEREASEPLVDASIPRGALLKESAEDLSRVWAKVDAIGAGAVITKTNGRLDVLSRKDIEARDFTTSPGRAGSRLRAPTPAPFRAVAPYNQSTPAAPPRSMVAIGGKPGRGLVPQGRGYALPPDMAAVSPYTRAEEFRAKTEAMLSALAAKADAQDRRIAALEAAAADRRVNALDVAHALGGIFKFALTGRG